MGCQLGDSTESICQVEIEGEDEWESWDEIPVEMYEEEEQQNKQELEWQEVDTWVKEILNKGTIDYQTTWVEDWECPLEEIVKEGPESIPQTEKQLTVDMLSSDMGSVTNMLPYTPSELNQEQIQALCESDISLA